MKIKIHEDGASSVIYTEEVNIGELGSAMSIKRASHVEPTTDNQWEADMSPSGGPVLGPFRTRSEALRAEVMWLEENIFKT